MTAAHGQAEHQDRASKAGTVQAWAYDFVEDRTRDGRRFRMLCVVDEFTREALAIRVARKLASAEVIDVLAALFLAHWTPAHLGLDQEPEFIEDGEGLGTEGRGEDGVSREGGP
ncbi:DDE-type integrase/transposase/recombinase, partial [Falsiroseomonas sp. HC035]|uniref:DDE-type integrase/transposase/recombinase n=1 Tax=Falsiroseomonas sp. HC035 TaxID=3390999 RepID=UPI003D315A4D